MSKPVKNNRSPWLWVWVAGAFLAMFAAWAVFFTVASQNHVDEVPLETHAPH